MSAKHISFPGCRHARFTLIEMLVVVGILAILFAILMPSLRRARIYAQDALCISNLRQIGTGIKSYLHDYDNIWPVTTYWLDDFGPFVQYIKNVEVFRCPGREKLAAMYDSTNVFRMTDYARNGTMADNELHNNFNNGMGNNPYHFDPSNPGKPVRAVVAAKTNDSHIIFERQHSNHFKRRFNVMFIDTFHYEQNSKGMKEYWTLDSRGWIETSLDPWPPSY